MNQDRGAGEARCAVRIGDVEVRVPLSGTADCEVVTDYAPDGLRCEISADLLSFQTSD